MTFASMLQGLGVSAMPVLLFIKATCLLLAALAASFVMMRASSGARHLVWLVVLSALLMLPLMAVWSPLRLEVLPRAFATNNLAKEAPVLASAPAPIPASSPAPGVAIAPAPTSGPRVSDAEVTHTTMSRLREVVMGSTRSVGESLLIVWFVVTLSLLGWLAYGAYSVRRIVRRARPLENPEWQTPLYEIADRFQLADAPRLMRSDDVRMPFACGVLHSTIVLPAESDSWSADRRSAVLLHELGHVQRRDLIGHTLGRVACALYWFHPLVWTAARRLRSESERACDDLALACGARPSDYAEHLLDIVTCVRDHATPSIALAMAHRKEFEGRMLAILNPELERKRPSRRQTAALVGTLAVMCVIVSAAAPMADAKVTDGTMADALPTAPNATNPDRSALSTGAQVHTSQSKATSTVTNTRTDTQLRMSTGQRGAKDNGAMALDLIRENALKSLGVMVPAVPGSPQASAPPPPPGGAQTRDDERPALLAKVLRTDTSSTLRRIAAWGLHEYADVDVAVDALVAAVDRDANAAVREMAAWSLSEAGRSERVTTALMAFSRRETDPKARATALWALGNIGDEKSLDAMVTALGSDDLRVRELAVWGIGNISPRHAPAQLLSALNDKEPRVRLLVAWALYTMEDATAVTALDAQLRKESDHDVQLGIVRALAATGEKSVETLKTLIESKDQELRAMAIRALAGAGGISPWPWPWPDPRPYP